MRKTRINAMKILNKTLSTYPNMYLALHEGIVDGDVATITDQSSSGLGDFTVSAPDAGQWGATYGNWEPDDNNTTEYITLEDVSGVADNFDALFGNLNQDAWMICFNIDYVRDHTGSQFLFNLRDHVADESLVEIRLNPRTGDCQPLLYDNTGTSASQSMLVADADNEQFCCIYVDMRSGVKQSTVYRLDPGSSVQNKSTSQTNDLSSADFGPAPSSAAGAGHVIIGARRVSSDLYNKHNDTVGLRDFRFINFGSNPPSDIESLIEELSINSNAGTRRVY